METSHFLTDEQLVALARCGDDSAMAILVARITPAVQARAAVNSAGSSVEFEDLTQEGMLGFLKAVYSFNEEGGASFRTYANTCINNRIISVLRSQSRSKDIPAPAIVSIDEAELELTAAEDSDPQDIISAEESVKQFDDKLNRKLSPLEKKVADLYMSGVSYADISAKLDISGKAVDNAIQRIRKKLR